MDLAKGNTFVYEWSVSEIAVTLLLNFIFIFTLLSLQLHAAKPFWKRLQKRLGIVANRKWFLDETSDHDAAESGLRQSWSIGPLRSWLVQVAKREMPNDLQGKLDPSDIAQQTMLDAWRGEQGFQGTTHAQRLAWLRVILRRVVLQHHRKSMATKRGEGRERAVTDAIGQASVRIEELAMGKEPQPDEGVDDAEKSLRLAEALEALPDDYRRVIELRHFDGKTHEQVAQELDRSNAAVRVPVGASARRTAQTVLLARCRFLHETWAVTHQGFCVPEFADCSAGHASRLKRCAAEFQGSHQAPTCLFLCNELLVTVFFDRIPSTLHDALVVGQIVDRKQDWSEHFACDE